MSMHPRGGDRVGSYEIRSELGHGSTGAVFEAVDQRSGREVALKIFAPAIAGDADALVRFEREATVLTRIRSRHIVPILDIGSDGQVAYVATELFGDGDLQTRLDRYGPLATDDAVAVVRGLAEAVADAHAVGVLHRDIKAANVLLARRADGLQGYLTDFGLVGPSSTPGAAEPDLASLATMAPERHRGYEADERSDVYALGCLLYMALAGEAPYTGTSYQVVHAHLNQPVPRVPRSVPQADAIDGLLATMMAKDPGHRPRTAVELVSLLGGLAPGSPAGATVSGPTVISPPGGTPAPGQPPGLAPPGGWAPPSPSNVPVIRPGVLPPATVRPAARRWGTPQVAAAGAVVVALIAVAIVVPILLFGGDDGASSADEPNGGPGTAPSDSPSSDETSPEAEEPPALTRADREAVAAIARGAPNTRWADDAQRRCGATSLVRGHPAAELRGVGLVDARGAYDGAAWTPGLGTAWFLGLIGCTDGWADLMAAGWSARPQASCLEDLGADRVGALLGAGLADTAPSGADQRRLTRCLAPPPEAATLVSSTPGNVVVRVRPSYAPVLQPTGYRAELDGRAVGFADGDRITLDVADADAARQVTVVALYPDGAGSGVRVRNPGS